ncbi:hypothetical protein F8568_044300 [Actinomadura sp. LD22]|uniref:Uncharacterized protein n=1 Tax=Actinomadura physcomitrii TaxID=2650748 RepID=A0A6I4MX91_9ACTN|nr:hypothetical protein [Actinomadura physcomitrii]MWA07239.1 hypothetical protein [Actinomadura physcomitrii]
MSVHLAIVFSTLAGDLGPGATGPGPRTYSERVRRVIDRVRSAQHGNVTLYSGANPFIGAGDVTAPWSRVWSIALELDRPASGSRPPGPDGDTASPEPGSPGATGFQGHPLIDATAGVPFSVASPEAVAAMMRHPQGDLRCYQRVTVAGHGQAVDAPDGRPVAPAEEKDVVLSASVYLAVEGRMLYGQFVATVLPPVREAYRIVDRLPDWDAVTLLLRTLTESWRTVLAGTLLAWPRMLTTCGTMARSIVAATSSGNPARKTSHDHGARISVRELFAEDGFATFVQETDVDKYMRLIERRVNEAILDHLSDECGIDVSAYRAQAGVILNQGVIMTGGTVHGQVASGRRVEQRQTRINP